MIAMSTYSLFHLSDGALRHELIAASGRARSATASEIAHIAEFDARRLYAPEGYPSMFAFCVQVLELSEDAALKRIQAARTAREFQVIFEMLADGRLSLSVVCLLAPRLKEHSAKEVLAAAVRKSKREIAQYLAERFPKPDIAARVEAIAQPQHAPGHVETLGLEHAPGHAGRAAPAPPPPPRPRVAPLAPERYAVQFTVGQASHELLRSAEDLIGHSLKADEMEQVFALGLQAMVAKIEKRKFAATDRPRAQRKPARGRHIPAAVKRAVRERDGKRCTFVAASGRRCEARAHLEYDHVVPVARGGGSTADNLRLLCRAHNQYEAEVRFGAGLMDEKRRQARDAAANGICEGTSDGPADKTDAADPQPTETDITPWL
jgi:hypothetical protein